MTTACLKITVRDGTTECFSESVGKDAGVDYAVMDQALHRLQEQSNSFLTVLVEKEKESNQNVGSRTNDGENGNGDDEESSEDNEDDKDKDEEKPPEKKKKI